MRLARPLRALLLATFFAPALVMAPGGVQPVAEAVGPLPDCRLDDIYTEPRGYDDWATTQVDWILSVGKGYAPPDLVSISGAGVTGGGLIRRVAFDDLKAMAAAARRAGAPLGNVSAYRSYKQQASLFNTYVKGYGFDKATTFSARPGHSEHQLGLVLDFADAGATKFVSEASGAGRWLSKNAWKYGWLMSYPDGKSDVVCYSYEPWHYRYVGRELARKIHDAGTTIRQYLWANFTQVDPACVALEPPPLKTPGPPRSCALAGPNPSAAASSPPAATAATSGAPPLGSPGSGPPTTTPGAPTAAPTSALGGALPVGLGLVLAVLALLAFASWRASRRRRSSPYSTRR
jgi:D-alanyl-D-alanine carboxypeptidase